MAEMLDFTGFLVHHKKNSIVKVSLFEVPYCVSLYLVPPTKFN